MNDTQKNNPVLRATPPPEATAIAKMVVEPMFRHFAGYWFGMWVADSGQPQRESDLDKVVKEWERRATIRVRSAVLWWKDPSGPDPREATHTEELIQYERTSADQYQLDICSTYEKCQLVAEWALLALPGDLAYLLEDAETRSVQYLTYILRRYSSSSPTQEPVSVPDEADTTLDDLGPEARRDFQQRLRLVSALEAIQTVTDRQFEEYAERLAQKGLPEAECNRRLAIRRSNLDRIVRDWMAQRGLRG